MGFIAIKISSDPYISSLIASVAKRWFWPAGAEAKNTVPFPIKQIKNVGVESCVQILPKFCLSRSKKAAFF